MKKRALAILLLLIIPLIIFTTIKANPISLTSINQIGQNQTANVLIKLKNTTSSAGFHLFALSTTNPKQEIKKQLGKNIQYSTSDLIYAKLNSTELKNLQNNPNVESITPERVFHVNLAHSTALINATTAQNTVYKNSKLNGTGETVCIIDSGVDYKLSDLGGCYGNNNASSNCTVIGGHNYINSSAPPLDDFGHGTHVAGIVAAHGTIKGVAPGAKIISIEACDSTGSCNEAYIQAGINWCVNNATKFNISVISLSVGTTQLYSGYCSSDTLAPSINTATAKNITVVAAAGNEGNTTAMSSPACIPGVIPVGATYSHSYPGKVFSWGNPVTCTDTSPKEDQIGCFSNRDSILKVFAPGALINSTEYPNSPLCQQDPGACSGNYAELGGTSMSTPFVSATVAIINQYLKMQKRTLNSTQIESALYKTGKPITGTNYTRINTESALLSIDSTAPNVTLISPATNYSSGKLTQNFSCNATDLSLKNMTLKIWNSTGLFFNTTKSISGTQNQTNFTVSNFTYGDYEWNCFASNTNNYTGYSTQNSTFTLEGYAISLTPKNQTYTKNNQTNFTCTTYDYKSNSTLKNVTFSLYQTIPKTNSTNETSILLLNQTKNITGQLNSTIFQYNLTNQTKYLWNCNSFTNNSTGNNSTNISSGNYSIYLDQTPPSLNITSPNNLTTKTGTQKISFSYNLTDNLNFSAIKNCSLSINNQTKATDSNITKKENSLSYTLSPGTYSWKILCFDKAGNENTSLPRTIKINSPPASVSSGGGGGGAAPAPSLGSAPTVKTQNITQGIYMTINEGGLEHFKLTNNQTHLISVGVIENNTAYLTVESSPINFKLSVGETKLLNLTSPYYYDLSVTLNSIANGKADLTIKEVTTNNRIFHTMTPKTNETNTTKPSNPSPKPDYKTYIIALVVILLIVAFYLIEREEKAKQNKLKKNSKKNKKKK